MEANRVKITNDLSYEIQGPFIRIFSCINAEGEEILIGFDEINEMIAALQTIRGGIDKFQAAE